MPQKGRPARRRDKDAHRAWLSEKREHADVDDSPSRPRETEECLAVAGEISQLSATTSKVSAATDFCSFYEAQRLFGNADGADAEYKALWHTMRSPLPVTVRVCRLCPFAQRTEAQLAARGWARRCEFARSGVSVWEFDHSSYRSERAWAEREMRHGTMIFQELVSMVPALLLAPSPEHFCLDLCAAPGNKSLQLLESLGNGGVSATGAVLSGEVDVERCTVKLTRLLSKASSPTSCAVYANAQRFPVLLESAESGIRLNFARILVDTPCSGDGTARKTSSVWQTWCRKAALELHNRQRNILLHALYLLPVGGLLAYSTCSMNPLENEAVVLSVLRKWRLDVASFEASGTVAAWARHGELLSLVDARAALENVCDLKADMGLTKWIVPAPDRGGPMFSSWDEVPAELRPGACRMPLRQEMFANSATPEDIAQLKLTARFYPHRCDTGGFYVALFRKTSVGAGVAADVPRPLAASTGGKVKCAAAPRPVERAQYRRAQPNDSIWREITEFFGIDLAWASEKLACGVLFWRIENEEIVSISLVSVGVAQIYDAAPADRKPLHWVKLGTTVFEQLPKDFIMVAPSRWRVAQEGASLIAPLLGKRRIVLERDMVLALLRADGLQAPLDALNIQDVLREACVVGGNAEHTDGPEADGRVVCGGVLVGVAVGSSGIRGDSGTKVPSSAPCCWASGALTPRQLRLLVDAEEAAWITALLLEKPLQQLRSCS
eukprot:TRINITY_DN44136_c0_g1_i1.p1 TRINITY_DN44136_c0_g1~~TRINITY_DN44136_c0_g1_i1.p1  ORF type:complete len:724 (-),score=93.45 TRINITY_DN44136_c0_g1_i1:93-2264(-)